MYKKQKRLGTYFWLWCVFKSNPLWNTSKHVPLHVFKESNDVCEYPFGESRALPYLSIFLLGGVDIRIKRTNKTHNSENCFNLSGRSYK